jgi:hypothetical protein
MSDDLAIADPGRVLPFGMISLRFGFALRMSHGG